MDRSAEHSEGCQRVGASAECQLPATDALAIVPQRGELLRRELAQSREAFDAAEAVDADQLDLGQALAQRKARQHAHEGRLVVEIVLEPELPAVTVTLVGLALIEKSLLTTAFTTRVTVVVWVADAPVPVTVTL